MVTAILAALSCCQPLVAPPAEQHSRLIHHVPPVYPRLAKEARIQGTVRLAALIGEDGRVERLRLISGHPLLVKASFDAVKRWRYLPVMCRGAPTSVLTIIEVSFTMSHFRQRRPPGIRRRKTDFLLEPSLHLA